MGSIVLHESSKIIQALDKDTNQNIVLDRYYTSVAGFSKTNALFEKYDTLSPENKLKVTKELIKKWRFYAQYPKVELALMDIYNEAVVADSESPVKINTSLIDEESFNSLQTEDYIETVKESLQIGFSRLLRKTDFRNKGTKYFKDWYIDGRLYLYVEYDKVERKKGITAIRVLDPMRLVLTKNGDKYVYQYDVFNDTGFEKIETIDIPFENIVFIPSGLISQEGIILSYLNKAIRPINLLHMMENSLVIYRFIRAPERWVFKIDVSNMNKKRARAYMERLRNEYRARFVINAVTGEVNSNNLTLAMQENFWFPKTNSQNGGHEINTIGGSGDFGKIDDIMYWKDEVDNALNVIGGKDKEIVFNFSSRIDEITQRQYKWFRFIKWLRSYFNEFFIQLMKIELVYSSLMSEEEFDEIKGDIIYEYENDSAYESAKERSKLEGILDMARNYEEIALKWWDEMWFRTKILKQTEQEAEEYRKKSKNSADNTENLPPELGELPPDNTENSSLESVNEHKSVIKIGSIKIKYLSQKRKAK